MDVVALDGKESLEEVIFHLFKISPWQACTENICRNVIRYDIPWILGGKWVQA